MAAEALNVLKRLPENRRCANCNSESQFGHGNVVVKFKSFVCGDCKSAHQAISHRVKVPQGFWQFRARFALNWLGAVARSCLLPGPSCADLFIKGGV